VAIGTRSVEIDVRNDSAAPVTDPPPNGAGAGLRGMAERAEALGGRIQAGRLPDGGWHVHAVLPLSPPSALAPGARPSGGETPWA
jgi:signal transduction histidine kinase